MTLDDSTVPAAALPYVLDPTTAYGNTQDGYAYGQDATYSIAQSTFGGFVTSAASYAVGQAIPAGVYAVRRIFLIFDTGAALPDNATVTAAELALKWQNDNSDTDFNIQVRKRTWATMSSDAEYDACIAAAIDTVWANSTQYAYAQYQSTALSDLTWIQTTTSTKYCLTSDRDASITQPSGSESVDLDSADATGDSADPYLSITYTVPPGCCDCAGIVVWSTCQGPVLVANTPVCPTQTPSGPACTYVADSTCVVK